MTLTPTTEAPSTPGTTDQPFDEYRPARAARGLVVLFQGRSDAASYYARAGQRLAADGYLVRVPAQAPTSADEAAAQWNTAVGTEAPEGPVLALTVDTAGGFLAGALSAKLLNVTPSGVVLTGLATPASGSPTEQSDPAALTSRSACPVHRTVVEATETTGDVVVSSTEIEVTLPTHALGVPTLVLHGDADEISPLPQLRKAWIAGPAELHVVGGGLHDVLNDVHHRSVAAVIVSFAERLRLSPKAARIIRQDTL